MNTLSADNLTDSAFAALARVADESSSLWREEDYAAIWIHQLQAPIWVELAAFDPRAAIAAAQLHEREPLSAPPSLGELLDWLRPSPRMLQYAGQLGEALCAAAQLTIPLVIAEAYRDVAVGKMQFELANEEVPVPLVSRLKQLERKQWLDDSTTRRIRQWLQQSTQT